ncbi:hypothetical protein QUA56_16780 [Microcoleus sp. N3A4]|uniref:hypothetical protein n=1 Tax=Microcoleus sp. N3A4 TaxID=3055379 RepID=UPI002FD45037
MMIVEAFYHQPVATWYTKNSTVHAYMQRRIFYAVLNDLYSSVAVELAQPHARISVEMVFRGLYDFSRAVWRDKSTNVVSYLVKTPKMLGSIKQ